MNYLSQFLVESILGEADSVDKVVVVYAGRFQPFHKGHYSTYQHLVKKFGKDNVFIGTSNKTDNDKSPFNFNEKVSIMTTMFGIPKSKIVMVKNPYRPLEILDKYDKTKTAFVTVVGEKDEARLGGKYFQKWKSGIELEGYLERGYVYVSPSQPNPISGTDVRNNLGKGVDDNTKIDFFSKRAYPKFNKKIYDLITNKLSESYEPLFISKEVIEEWVVTKFPKFLEEASQTQGKTAIDDGPNFFFPNYDVFNNVSKDRAEHIGYTLFKQIMDKKYEDYYEHPIYPKGPVKAVTPFPAGVIGKTTATNQKDFTTGVAYDLWFKHVTRTMALAGYSLVRDKDEIEKRLSTKDLASYDIMLAKKDPLVTGDIVREGLGLAMGYPSKVDLEKKLKQLKDLRKKLDSTKKGDEYYEPYAMNGGITEDILRLNNSLNLDRKVLPQIDKDELENYLEYLESNNIPFDIKFQPIASLNSTQSEVDTDKVKSIMNDDNSFNTPIIVSKDDYILDGHHRALAAFNTDKEAEVPVIKVDLSLYELINISNEFVGSYNSEITENNNISGLGGGNNSARWTAPGKEKKLNFAQLSGYTQEDYPTADELDISGEEFGYVSTSSTAKYHNKRKAKRSETGELIFEENLKENIENSLRTKYKVDLDVYEYPTHLELRRIVVPQDKRGQGLGSRVMGDLIKYAQSNKKDLFTTPSSDFGGSKSRLVQFYKSFGFKDNKGSNRDFRSKETMVRLSENQINENAAISLLIRLLIRLGGAALYYFSDNIIDSLTRLIKPGNTVILLKRLKKNKQFYKELGELIKKDSTIYYNDFSEKLLSLPSAKKELEKLIKDKNLSEGDVSSIKSDIQLRFRRSFLDAAEAIKRQFPQINQEGKLNEGKQVGVIYHYTDKKGLDAILKSNSLKSGQEYYLGNDIHFISFTRNKNFHRKGMSFNVKIEYRIAINGNKLSNRYKIKPFAYIPGWDYEDNFDYDWLDDEPESVKRDFFNATGEYDEQEERITFKKPTKIPNIKSYILKVDKVSDLKANEGVELEKLGIKDFKSLFKMMPFDLQKRVYNLKNFGQRLDKHPEGNVLKHTIMVVNRSLKDDDIDIAIAAMFHDIGKDETAGIHPTKGHITHFGHEKVSASLVSKYKDWIKSVGGNPANVLYIVKNHMRYKQLSDMRPQKQDKLKSFRAYDKLSKFSKHDRGGLDESKQLKLNIPSDIKKIHSAFKKNGKKLYVVGGAVRDAILGNSPKDFDLATDAKPDEVLQIAKDAGFSTAEVGKAFGVVIVNGHEIATFRKDIGKGRRPSTVDYTDIEGDVKRRDLTVNALFYDMDKETIVDLVGGIEDLKKKNIRTVGNAVERFDEDPLRKLRALRFQARLGGNFDKELLDALQKDPSLKGVSAERIRDEFIKSIKTAKDTKQYMELSDKIGFTPLIFPNLKITKPYSKTNDYILFISAILRKNSPSILAKSLSNLRYTNEERNDIVFLVSLQQFKPEEIVNYKKLQEKTSLSDNQILEFGKIIGKDFKKFINFKLSVGGKDVPSDIKGPQIGLWIKNKEKENYLNEGVLSEIPMDTLQKIDQYADKQLNPVDIVLTDKHFFDRLQDPRNKKDITPAELIGFFKRLAKEKKKFVDFLNQYGQIVAKDNRSKINIPFMKQANKVIAKTIMRKDDFKTTSPEYKFEDITIPVNIGDTILTGRFKNKRTVIKSIGEDEYGMPTINGRKVANFRIVNNK